MNDGALVGPLFVDPPRRPESTVGEEGLGLASMVNAVQRATAAGLTTFAEVAGLGEPELEALLHRQLAKRTEQVKRNVVSAHLRLNDAAAPAKPPRSWTADDP